MSRKELLSAFKVWLESQRFSKGYIESYILEVELFLVHCGEFENILDIDSDVIKEYINYFNEAQNIVNVCKAIISVKSFYDFLYLKGQIQEHPFEGI